MEWKYFKYKKFFEPLAREYKKAYQYLENLDNKFEQLVQLEKRHKRMLTPPQVIIYLLFLVDLA